jgi:hypothetical protein
MAADSLPIDSFLASARFGGSSPQRRALPRARLAQVKRSRLLAYPLPSWVPSCPSDDAERTGLAATLGQILGQYVRACYKTRVHTAFCRVLAMPGQAHQAAIIMSCCGDTCCRGKGGILSPWQRS